MTFRATTAPSNTAAITTDTAARLGGTSVEPPMTHAEPSHRERVAKATSKSRDNRSRYHGKVSRGRMTVADLDIRDITAAIRELERARQRLVKLTHAADTSDRDERIALQLERADTYATVRLASHYVDEVVCRSCR